MINLKLNVSTINTDRPMYFILKFITIYEQTKQLLTQKKKQQQFISTSSTTYVTRPKNVLLGHLNVHSLNNKIEAVEEIMRNNIAISLFSETKLHETFPNHQFKNNGYKMFKRDRNKHGRGTMFYINENIPCKTVNVEDFPDDCQFTLMELSVKN